MGGGEDLQWTESAWKKDLRALWSPGLSEEKHFQCVCCLRCACEESPPWGWGYLSNLGTPIRIAVRICSLQIPNFSLNVSLSYMSCSIKVWRYKKNTFSIPVHICSRYAHMCAAIVQCHLSFSRTFQFLVCQLRGVCVSLCGCAHAHMVAYLCRTDDVRCLSQSLSSLLIEREGLSVNLVLTEGGRFGDQWAGESRLPPSSTSPGLEFIVACHPG